MSAKADIIDAVKTIVETLRQQDQNDWTKIINATFELLGKPGAYDPTRTVTGVNTPPPPPNSPNDIKSFIEKKLPKSEIQFAAAVAYYYRFEAPEAQKKASITKEDLIEATRLANRTRLKKPAQTLVNALGAGILNRAESGSYSINSVGENLVAMTMPSTSGQGRIDRKKPKKRKPRK